MCVDTGFKSRLYLINEVWDRVFRFHLGPQRFGQATVRGTKDCRKSHAAAGGVR